MADTDQNKEMVRERPTNLFIVVVLEALAGIWYLIDIVAYASIDITSAFSIALMFISFLVAYGLWRLARWAWVVSLALSLFGVVSAVPILAISGASEGVLLRFIPSIALDVLIIVMLLTRGVKGLFWGKKADERKDLKA